MYLLDTHTCIYCVSIDTALSIGNGLTSIAIGAFHGCYRMQGALVIPDTITTIEIYAFADCYGFTGMYLCMCTSRLQELIDMIVYVSYCL